MKINLIEEIDQIDDNNWSIWTCEVTLLDGRTVAGEIQSDGYTYDLETLTDENGDEFPQ
jgi:hypothetical protein